MNDETNFAHSPLIGLLTGAPCFSERHWILQHTRLIAQTKVPNPLKPQLGRATINWIKRHGRELEVWTGDHAWTDHELITACVQAIKSLECSDLLANELKNTNLTEAERHWLTKVHESLNLLP